MPRAREHWLDDLAEDIFLWIQRESDVLAEALKAGGRSPFAARVSEQDKIAFYRQAFFNKDGSPNERGRAETLARVGVDGYAQIMSTLMDARKAGTLDEEETA